MVSDTIYRRAPALLCAVYLMAASAGALAGSDVVLSSNLKTKLLDLPHITGEPLTAEDLAGKVTIVSFFASWCPPCNAEFNHLAELRTRYGSDLTILSINVFEEYGEFKDRDARLRRFLSRHKPEHAVITGNPTVRDAFGSSELQNGLLIPAVRYLEAQRLREPMLAEFCESVFEKVDVLHAPISEQPPPLLDDIDPHSPSGAASLMLSLGRLTRPISYLDLPALAVSCGFIPNGLPAGFQLIGRPYAEALLLRFGHAYQA